MAYRYRDPVAKNDNIVDKTSACESGEVQYDTSQKQGHPITKHSVCAMDSYVQSCLRSRKEEVVIDEWKREQCR